MKLIFCADPLHPREPDEAFAAEVAATRSLGIDDALISYEALVNAGSPARAVQRVAEPPAPELAVYRGWMLRPAHYQALYEALAARGLRLINSPAAYRHGHYLHESYPVIAGRTQRSVWMPSGPDVDIDAVMALLRPFGAAPVIVKDYVKSRKHEWADACFIPSAADRVAVERVVRRFLELQDDDLNEGLVFREYVEFEPLAIHAQSGMPLSKEFRVFFLDAEPIYWAPYWAEGDYGETVPPIDELRTVAQAVQSRFFTMDLARRPTGEWMIIELGDGQVAGLPETADPIAFYQALNNRLTTAP